GDRAPGDELPPDDERVGKSVGAGLDGVADAETEGGAVAQEPPERLLLVGCGDDQYLPDAGQHERRQRVVDHRLVVDGQELLAHRERERMQPGACSAGKDDSLHAPRALVTTLRPDEELAVRATAAARMSTRSSIGRVSLPVKVFCWLGW